MILEGGRFHKGLTTPHWVPGCESKSARHPHLALLGVRLLPHKVKEDQGTGA